MLPSGYTRILLADTRRALAWERGLARAGFAVRRVAATGQAEDKADWALGVPQDQLRGARAFVSDVLQGNRRLPAVPVLSGAARVALFGIGAVVVAVVVAALLGR